MALLAEVYVTQIALISQIFCIAVLAGGWRGFLILLALRAEIYKSGRLFPAGFSSGYGAGLNLDYVYTPSSRHSSSELDSVLDFRSSVDFYKVSLAARDGLVFRWRGFFVTQIAQKAQN